MKRIFLYSLLLAGLLSTPALTACHDTTVGYLDTQYAAFSTKEEADKKAGETSGAVKTWEALSKEL